MPAARPGEGNSQATVRPDWRDAARRRVARACPDAASRHRRRHRTLPRAARPNLSSRRRSFLVRRAVLPACATAPVRHW